MLFRSSRAKGGRRSRSEHSHRPSCSRPINGSATRSPPHGMRVAAKKPRIANLGARPVSELSPPATRGMASISTRRGTARFQLIWRFWKWDSRHPECQLAVVSMRQRLNIGARQTMRTATDRHSLLMGIMLNSNHPVHARLLPEGGVSAGPSNETRRAQEAPPPGQAPADTGLERGLFACLATHFRRRPRPRASRLGIGAVRRAL